MKKTIKDMTTEEKYALFPIIIKPYDKRWPDWYNAECQRLLAKCHKEILRINHIGSTAVTGLSAKPTIDILCEIDEKDAQTMTHKLISVGFSTEGDPLKKPLNMVFYKGYTLSGYAEKVFHLHLREKDDHDELYFRDLLRTDTNVKHAYAKLKQDLALTHFGNREAYTDAKTDFIKENTLHARNVFGSKYVK